MAALQRLAFDAVQQSPILGCRACHLRAKESVNDSHVVSLAVGGQETRVVVEGGRNRTPSRWGNGPENAVLSSRRKCSIEELDILPSYLVRVTAKIIPRLSERLAGLPKTWSVYIFIFYLVT